RPIRNWDKPARIALRVLPSVAPTDTSLRRDGSLRSRVRKAFEPTRAPWRGLRPPSPRFAFETPAHNFGCGPISRPHPRVVRRAYDSNPRRDPASAARARESRPVAGRGLEWEPDQIGEWFLETRSARIRSHNLLG